MTLNKNTQRFSGKAALYAQHREKYDPAIVLPFLRERTGLTPEMLIADVGAGTGMLGDVFLSNGNRVIAVEPNDEMRAMCLQLHAEDSLLQVVCGTAEQTTLPDRSVDMVVAGRAFHWFDVDAAMEEFRRILKPGGWVCPISFGRADKATEIDAALEVLLGEYSPTGRDTRAAYAAYERVQSFFQDGAYYQEQRLGKMELTWEQLLRLMLSYSHSPLSDSALYEQFVQQLRAIFDAMQQQGKLSVTSRYWMNAGRFSS